MDAPTPVTPEELARDLAGFHRTRLVALGAAAGLFRALIREKRGLNPDELADRAGTHRAPTRVFCLAACAQGLLVRDGSRYRVPESVVPLVADRRTADAFGPQALAAAAAGPPARALARLRLEGGRAAALREEARAAHVAHRLEAELLPRHPALRERLAGAGPALVMGCGGGALPARLLERARTLVVHAVEEGDAPRRRAAARLAEHGGRARVDAAPAGTGYAAVLFPASLPWFGSPAGAAAAGAALLAPGGVLVAWGPALPEPGTPDVLAGALWGLELEEALEGRALPTRAQLDEWLAGAGLGARTVVELAAGWTATSASSASP
jgi:hypothetical protein